MKKIHNLILKNSRTPIGGVKKDKGLIELSKSLKSLAKSIDELPTAIARVRETINEESGRLDELTSATEQMPSYMRLLIGVPATGLVRMEWVMARYGQVIPTNWSMADCIQWLSAYSPMEYTVADAQNLIVKVVIEKNFEWLLFLEQDVIIPQDAFLKINQYMRDKTIPVVAGLYFTKSVPGEPLLYRGRGVSFYTDWKLGDRVWVDGVPMGFTLIHSSILRLMWEDSPEYAVKGALTRRVFTAPAKVGDYLGAVNAHSGTSDLNWCTRVINGKYLERAGWHKIAKKKYPFLVDTTIFCRHIDEDGNQYPLEIPR